MVPFLLWLVGVSVCLCIYLSACLSMCWSVCLAGCLPICLPVSLWVKKSFAICTNAIHGPNGKLGFLSWCKNTFLVITFELKHITWWFWCLGLCFEGQGTDGSICFNGWSVCLSVHLSLSQSVPPMANPTVCLVIKVNLLTVIGDSSCLVLFLKT